MIADEADEIYPSPPRKRKRKPASQPDSNYLADVHMALGRYVLIYGTEEIWDTNTMLSMRPPALRLLLTPPVYKEWAGNPNKRVVMPTQVVFDPTGQCGDECINLFEGFSMQPKKGDCADLLALLVHLLADSADNDYDMAVILAYVLDWFALPLQQPGAKMGTALIIHGPQGTGKNLFVEAIAKIYGHLAAVVGQAQLESRYNDWASRKLLLIGDELVASYELAHHKNVLKSLVTGETIPIEAKFKPMRMERNHANFVFLSNDAKPLALERDDRRHLVIYCPPKRTDGLYERVRESFDRGSIEAFYDMLMRRDLTNFHTHSPPPMTRAKSELIDIGLKPAERFAMEWLTKALDLPLWPCSGNQLYRAFTRWCRVNGERIPPNQSTFSSLVGKYAGNRLERQNTSPSPTEPGVPIKLWLPKGTGPVDGVRWFDFAQDCVGTFEGYLTKYCGAAAEGGAA